jgi:hypothetical protein
MFFRSIDAGVGGVIYGALVGLQFSFHRPYLSSGLAAPSLHGEHEVIGRFFGVFFLGLGFALACIERSSGFAFSGLLIGAVVGYVVGLLWVLVSYPKRDHGIVGEIGSELTVRNGSILLIACGVALSILPRHATSVIFVHFGNTSGLAATALGELVAIVFFQMLLGFLRNVAVRVVTTLSGLGPLAGLFLQA